MAKMKPHYHEDEYMYIVDAKDAFVTYGPTKETMTTREPLHAGEIIRAKDGEWHLFDFDSEDGFLSIIAFFGVPIGHTKEGVSMSIPETMKAVYLVEPFKLEVREVSTPKIERDTDVLVKVHTVGVCGSDLTAWKGNHPDMKMPSIPGHEIAGEVVAVGSAAVTKVKVGDHVIREPIEYCGKCYAAHGHLERLPAN